MRIESSLRGMLTVFFRQFRKFFVLLLLLLGATFFYAKHVQYVYESTGSLLVRFGNDARPDISKLDGPQPDLAPNERRELIESYTRILTSHDLLTSLIMETGVEQLYPAIAQSATARDSAVEQAYLALIKGDFTVKVGTQSNLIELRMLSGDPKIAANFLKRLCEQFMKRQTEVLTTPQIDFITQQVQHASEELKKAQQALQEYKTQYGLSSVDEEMNRLMQEKSDSKTVALRSIDEAQTRVDELKSKETQLLMTYQEDSPTVQKLRENLTVAQGQLRQRQYDLKASTAGAVSAGAVSPHIKDIDRRLAQLEAHRGEYDDLARQVQIAEDHYKQYTAKREEARVKETLNSQNISRISMLDEPNVAMTPLKPNKKLIMLLGSIGALLCALGMAIAAERLDQRFSRPEQLAQHLGVPSVSTIPFLHRR